MNFAPNKKAIQPFSDADVDSDMMVRALLKDLKPFLDMEGATEIVINRPGEVFVEIGPLWQSFAAPRLDYALLTGLAKAISVYCDQDISPQNPLLSAILPDRERIQIVVPPAVGPESISFSIRKPGSLIKSLEAFEAEGMFSRFQWMAPSGLKAETSGLNPVDKGLVEALSKRDLKAFFQKAVLHKKNIAVVGETGSGKTTLMKSICQSIPSHERLITIEDVRELVLPSHPNCVHLLYTKGGQGVARITPADLIATTMRMKPDRVLLAELRGSEAFDYLKLLTTGHSGSITSYHAESCALAPDRYVMMCKEHPDAGIFDAASLKRLVTMTIDIVVHVSVELVFDDEGGAVRKDRYISEIGFDPVAKGKLRAETLSRKPI